MTMKATITEPVAPVALDAFGTIRPRDVAPKASPRPTSVTIRGPSLVVVVPDKVDAVLGACGVTGVKSGPKLLWSLAFLLLLAV
jgi:hypothetical protein